MRLLRSSRHLQIIALVIAFAAIGAAIIEQQLNMAAAEAKGAQNSDAIAAFLGAGHRLSVADRLRDPGGADQPHPSPARHRLRAADAAGQPRRRRRRSCCSTARCGRRASARILDTSLRYTVDKTSREVLFLPLPAELKYRAKPFIDVTMDRFAKGVGALLILVLHQGLGPRSRLAATELRQPRRWSALWVRHGDGGAARVPAVVPPQHRAAGRRARRRAPQQPDPQSIETLVSELAHPEPRRVLYAIDLLESMDKRHLVTPLLLAHESPEVRARAHLRVAEAAGPKLRRAMAARRRAGAEGSRRQRPHRRGVGAGVRCAARPPST